MRNLRNKRQSFAQGFNTPGILSLQDALFFSPGTPVRCPVPRQNDCQTELTVYGRLTT